MNRLFFRMCLLVILLTSGLSGAEEPHFWEPTHFSGVTFPEISASQRLQFQKITSKFSGEDPQNTFSDLYGFLRIHGFQYFPTENQKQKLESIDFGTQAFLWESIGTSRFTIHETTAAHCRSIVESLPENVQAEWRKYIDSNVQNTLQKSLYNSSRPSTTVLKRLLFHNPCSSYEQELWECLAQKEWESGNTVKALRFWTLELNFLLKFPQIPQKSCILQQLPSVQNIKLRIQKAQEKIASSDEIQKHSRAASISSSWKVTMTQILSPEKEVIFEDFLPTEQRGTLFLDRKRNIQQEMEEFPQFKSVSPDENFLVARLGTLISIWPELERASRPQAYLIVMDLTIGGQLLWIKSPESVQSVFVGNPLTDVEFVYIPTMNLRSSRADFFLNIYALSDGTLLQQIPLFAAEVPNSATESIFLPILWNSDGRLLIGGPASGVQVLCDVF